MNCSQHNAHQRAPVSASAFNLCMSARISVRHRQGDYSNHKPRMTRSSRHQVQ